MFQIFLAVILIFAVSYQYDVPKEPGWLSAPPETLPSHSGTCLQVEDSKSKPFTFQLCETLWVEGLRCRSRHDKINTENTNQKSTLIKTKGKPKEIPTTKINGLTFHKLNVLFDTGSSNVNLISNHLVKHLNLKLQPEGFKRKILTAIGSKLVQYQYIDLHIRRNYFTMDPILRQVRFLHSEEQEVNLGRGNSPSRNCINT